MLIRLPLIVLFLLAMFALAVIFWWTAIIGIVAAVFLVSRRRKRVEPVVYTVVEKRPVAAKRGKLAAQTSGARLATSGELAR